MNYGEFVLIALAGSFGLMVVCFVLGATFACLFMVALFKKWRLEIRDASFFIAERCFFLAKMSMYTLIGTCVLVLLGIALEALGLVNF